MIIGSGFFEKKSVDKVTFAIDADLPLDGEVYKILDIEKMSDSKFKEAISLIKF